MRIRAAVAATVLAVLGVPTPAQAQRAVLPSELSLALRDDGSGAVSLVELACHPTGGTHPQAEATCRAFDAAGGDPDRLPPKSGFFCYQLYQPVTAAAVGWWDGRPVRWQQTFGNVCELHTRTGLVFNF